jgi:hypothetical protein
MKIYTGLIEDGEPRLLVHTLPLRAPIERVLNPRYDLANHSPAGYAWGYDGSGPAQLALALLADVLHDDARALHLHQLFKESFVERLPQGLPWCLSDTALIVIVSHLWTRMAAHD